MASRQAEWAKRKARERWTAVLAAPCACGVASWPERPEIDELGNGRPTLLATMCPDCATRHVQERDRAKVQRYRDRHHHGKAPPSHRRWEYLSLPINHDESSEAVDLQANELGEGGWEAVGFYPGYQESEGGFRLLFKRPKRAESKGDPGNGLD